MTPADSKRYKIDNIDTFLRVLHSDHRYALAFRNKAEQHITAKLRRKFVKTSPDVVIDAFNNTLVKFLQSKTFRDEGFLDGQPKDGWTAHELATSNLGGYLYRGSANEMILAYRRSKHHLEPAKDGEQQAPGTKRDEANELSDDDPLSDPALAYEHSAMLERMRECLNKLTDKLRATMFLWLDDMNLAEIAERQDIPVATVKSRIHAAQKFVADCTKRGME